jgi:hypothetical protein
MNEPIRERQESDPRPMTTADIAESASPHAAYMPPGSAEKPSDPGGLPMPRSASQSPPPGVTADEPRAALFPPNELEQMRSRWGEIQSEFVDAPKRSVEEADQLVATAIKRLADSFAGAKSGLEGQWQRGGDISTEDLRMALRRYRSFFDRLLAA